MKILFSLCGDQTKASSRVRGFWVAEALQEIGHESRLRVTDSKLQLLYFARDILWADSVVFQKTYSRYHLVLMRLAKCLGKNVYLDVDDMPSRSGSVKTLKNFGKMARAARAVFAGSEELAKDVMNAGGRALIVPTGVKVANYTHSSGAIPSRNPGEPVSIGWIGNGAHYEEDLIEILLPAVRAISPDSKFKLKLVGVAGSEKLRAAVENINGFQIELIDQLNWADPHEIAAQLASFDIGVYPLLNNAFNDRKCGFKALEYLATGIPVVASRNGANAEIVREAETGYLVSNEAEWVRALSVLIDDARQRESMGQAGKARVESDFDISSIAKNIAGILAGSANGG